jgi:long-chain fatty acid transport protein
MGTRFSRFYTVALAAASSLALGLPAASAGGLARPNPISARSVGMGGAFSAIADDPTALHFNPAGLARTTQSNVLIGGEFIVAPRTYEPDLPACETQPDSAPCQTQSPTSPVRPLPSLGFSTRLQSEGVPSRLAFGVGVWNSFGGQLEYQDDPPIGGTLKSTRNAVIEVVPGVAYEVNDVMAIGAAFRLGVGLFDSEAISRPSDAELSAKGIGAGATLGILITPSETLSVGAYYRTALNVTTTGSGVVHTGTDLDVDVEFTQKWPQQAGMSVAMVPVDKVTLAVQFDWIGWSLVDIISPQFAGDPALTRQAAIVTDWDDNYQLHAGAQVEPSKKLAIRGGFTFDSIAVTPRLRERQFLDGNSIFLALGGSYHLTKKLRVDTAFEYGPGGTTTIPNNAMEVSAWPSRANVAPGDHSGQLYTLELAFQYLY